MPEQATAMKLAASLVLPCLFAAACGAAVKTDVDNDNEDEKTTAYRVWGQFPWEGPGNPSPIFPPDDFLMSETGLWGNKNKPREDASRPWRDLLKYDEGESGDEYRILGKFPWERPHNPPPFLPPSDTVSLSQIGRWWNQDYLNGIPPRPARYSDRGDDGENTAESASEDLATPKDHKLFRVARSVWYAKPWEKPWNPPPFLSVPFPQPH